MARGTLIALAILFGFLSGNPATAADLAEFNELQAVIDSAQVLEVGVFAPKTWEKGIKKFAEAQQAVDQGKNQKTLNQKVSESREFVESAIKATEVCKLSLQEYLDPRDRARTAQAPTLVPELYAKAEDQFMKATEKVESGDVKNGLKEAEKARPLFDTAEIEAIRTNVLGAADRLIERAIADEADKFALSTLDKARTARQKADAIITNDRYNRDDAVDEAMRAEYQARHASNIAQSVRSLNRNDQAWEKLMLIYEIQMNRVGEAIGAEFLPFDEGALAAADTLINYVKGLQAQNDACQKQSAEQTEHLTKALRQTAFQLGVAPSDESPAELADMVDKRVTEMLSENKQLAQQIESGREELSVLTAQNKEISGELSTRLDREKKFKAAKALFNPSEGEVLFNASNDIVMRLSGLSFDVGKSDIQDEHTALLGKVKQAIEMFPDAQYVVEGHTDASGDPKANLTLSEKRAYSVMQYLRQSMLIPADKIQSMGYGADRPVASNQTRDGRAKNRRIDILIMQ
ncbi:MAG: OmpA family protein [candidate division Zixibacteria bacterium]|nr:OmpA family protein [candidate division Zixibacteria bacterium]